MTWYKHGTEFPDDCAEANLSDAAFRTHVEAINYIYRQENFDLTVKKSTMRRWVGSDQAEQATVELVAKGWWSDGETEWTVVHHADVIRQSLAAQIQKRNRDTKAQRNKRARDRDREDHVSADISADVAATQSDRQTDKQPRQGSSSDERLDWVTGEVQTDSPNGVCPHPLTSALQRQRGMCNSCWVTADAQRKTAES